MSYTSANGHPPVPPLPPPSIPKNNNNDDDKNNDENATPSYKKKISLTVNTAIAKKPSFSTPSSPKMAPIPKIITPSSPSKSVKSIKSPASVSTSPSDSTKSSSSQKGLNTPLKKKKIKLASSRNSFLHGSPLYGEVSNKMSLLFHAAHNESNKKSGTKKSHTSSLSNASSSSSHSSPRNSTSSYPASPVLITTSTNNINSLNSLDRQRLSVFSTASDASSHKSVHSTATVSTNANSNDKSVHTVKDSHDSASASFISALSTHSVSPTNNRGESYDDYTLSLEKNHDDTYDEGMFDTFNFENMIANRFNEAIHEKVSSNNYNPQKVKSDLNTQLQNKLLALEKIRVVSDPVTTKSTIIGLGVSADDNMYGNDHHIISNSAPTTRKPSDNISRNIPPMSNNLICKPAKAKSPVPLQLQPITPLGHKVPVLDASMEYPTNKVSKIPTTSSTISTNPLTNAQSTKSVNSDNIIASSPIKTESSSNSGKTSRNVSRSGSIQSRTSTTSTLQKGGYSNKSGNTHKRSSSKGSLHDITTPKSFFKFFGSKKYNSNESHPPRNSNGHSHSNSQSSDTFSVHSGQGISPIVSSNTTLQTTKYNSTVGSSNTENITGTFSSSFNAKNNFRARWEENNKRQSLISDIDQNGNDTLIAMSPIDAHNKSEDVYPVLNTGSMPTLIPSKNTSAANSIKHSIYESKSRAGSVDSLGSYKSSRALSSAIPVPTSTESSSMPSASLYSFHNKLSKSSDSTIALSNRNSILSQTSQSAGTTPTSANPTIVESSEYNASSPTSAQARGKVKSLVKLGSKSIRYSRGSSLQNKSFNNRKKPLIPHSDWDSWDGHSGSFEKIGPVGKKPNPPGQTIPVVTTSNLHSTDEKKSSTPTRATTSLIKPSIARLSSSSLPTLIASNDNNYGFVVDHPPSRLTLSINESNNPSAMTSNNTSNSNLLSIYAAPSNSGSKVSIPDEYIAAKYASFNLNAKFLPKTRDSSNKIMVTSNFVDYKLLDFTNICTYPKFVSSMQNMLRIKSDVQIHIIDVGSTRDHLGKKLDKQAVQSIWDHLNTCQGKTVTFYVTADDKLKIPEVTGSPNKFGIHSKGEHHSLHHDKMEETSLYTTSSYTNSINSDSSFDKNQPTPQHLISVRKDSNIDYWNFKDVIERKPSLTRAISVTHSSISGDGGAVVSPAPNLSRKTSKISVTSTGSSLTSQSNSQNPPRSSTMAMSTTSQIASSSDKKLKGSFKVIPPQKPHVDFDNKRASPFVKSNLIAQRFPPAPPPGGGPPLPTAPPSSPPHTLQSVQSSDSSPGMTNRQLKTMEKPPAPGFSRASRSQKKNKMVSNSLRSLQRSNTQGSLFSTMSSSSGISVDPFSENKVSFNNFESDDDTTSDCSDNTTSDDDDSNDDEFGLFSKKPKGDTKSKSKSKSKKLEKLKISHDKVSDTNSSSSSDDDNDDGTFDLFQKRPKNLKPPHTDDESTNDVTLTSPLNIKENADTEGNRICSESTTANTTEKESSSYDKIDKSSLAQKRKKVPPPLKLDLPQHQFGNKFSNESTPTGEKRNVSGDSVGASPADALGPLSHPLNLRPPPEVLYNNLEVFFPKADLDSLIIDEAPTNGTGMGRMKSIRIIAQEASRRASYRSPLSQAGNTGDSIGADKRSKLNNRTMNSLSAPRPTNASLLRRKSTKMWGQKVVEVTNNKKNVQRVIPRRGRNGEILEFAWIKGELIGIGKFGRVHVAMNVTTGDLIAVKQMSVNHKFLNCRETNDIVDTFKAEIDSLKDLDHINIVQYLGFEIKDNTYSIFLEYVSGGSIGHLLRKYGRFDEPLVKDLTVQMLHGLNYIHSKGILHRDLKADNLLLEVDGVLKISDFGISKRAKDIYTSQSKLNFQGTIFWMAPEIINDTHGVGYNAKVDIWALGCVIMEMFTGERPWSKYEGEGVLYKLGKEKSAPPIKKEIRKEISACGKHFMKRCFEVDAVKRPTAQTLLGDPFCELEPDFDFAKSTLGKRFHVVEEQEKENLSKRMQSMVRKL